MKNLSNATMESSILHELAAFDIRAPINFTISFEDSDETDEVTVKTENVLNDDYIQNQDTDELPNNVFKPKIEIKQEPETTEETPISNDLNCDKQTEPSISNEISTLQTEIVQNNTTNCDDQRKRKQELLQIYKNKSARKGSLQENVSNHTSNYDNENETHKDKDTDTSQLNPINVESNAAVPSTINEWERNRISSYIIRCLVAVSENLRITMEALLHYKQNNTPYEWFKNQKLRCFNASYNTVVKVLLPERQNQEFITTFLNGTHQHALKISPLSKCCVQDYAVLLMDLLSWAAEKQKQMAQTAGKNENIVHQQLNASNASQRLVLESTYNKPDANNSYTGAKADTICIFSSGAPGNEISINIDPNLTQHLSKTDNFKKKKIVRKQTSSKQTPRKLSIDQGSQDTLPRSQVSLQSQPETQGNNKNKHLQELLQRPPLFQPFASCIPSEPETDNQSQLYPEMYKYMCNFNSAIKENVTYNDIVTKQINTGLPQVQKSLEMQNGRRMPQQSRHPLSQSMPSQQMLPQSQQSVNAAQRHSTHAPPIYGPSTCLAPPTCGPLTRPGPPTCGPLTRPGPPTCGPLTRPGPPTCGPLTRPGPPTCGPLTRPGPPTCGPLTRPGPPTCGPLTCPAPTTCGPLTRPGPPTCGPLTRPGPPTCGPLTRPGPVTSNQMTRPAPPTCGQMTRPGLPTCGPLIRPAPPTNGPSACLAPRTYGPLTRPAPPTYAQSTWIPPPWQQEQQNSQHVQPNYSQSKHMQQFGHQQHHMQPQYGQFQQVQREHQQLQHAQQYDQLPMRQSQPILPPPLSPHVSPQIRKSLPLLPECEQPLQIGEWHEGLRDLYQGQIQPQIHERALRSTSTDSGFISPLNFNASSDQTEPPVPEETETSSILITHVTSLNPKVPLMADGTCVVCNTTTKKVCMGCMKLYYCTYECQRIHWPTHGPDCCSTGTAQPDHTAGRNK